MLCLGYVFTSVCLFVCLSARLGLLKKLWTDFDEIFGGSAVGVAKVTID